MTFDNPQFLDVFTITQPVQHFVVLAEEQFSGNRCLQCAGRLRFHAAHIIIGRADLKPASETMRSAANRFLGACFFNPIAISVPLTHFQAIFGIKDNGAHLV